MMLASSLFANIELNNVMYDKQVVEPIVVVVTAVSEPDRVPLKEPITSPESRYVTTRPDLQEIVVDIFTETVVSVAEARLKELPSEYGLKDELSLIDVVTEIDNPIDFENWEIFSDKL